MNNNVIGLALLLALLGVGFAAIVLIRWGRLSFLVDRGVRAARTSRYDDMGLIARYHRSANRAEAIDDRTWYDLDLDQVLAKIDYTASTIGTQTLYDRLRSPAELERFSATVEALRSNPPVAERIRETLRRLDGSNAGWLPDLFTGDLPAPLAFRWVYPMLSLAMVAALVATTFNRIATVAVVALVFLNFLITLFFKSRIQLLLPGLRALPNLVYSGESIVANEAATPFLATEVGTLRRTTSKLKRLRGAARWLLFEPGETADLMSSLYEYVNMLFLLSVNAVAFGIEQIRDQRSALRETYEAIGWLDVAQSVATLRDGWTTGSRPRFHATAKQFDVANVWHPLLSEPVANSIAVSGTSVLVTGSNMSGKTTFVRTLGVAATLARAIDTVPAMHWRCAALVPRTSIARSDSLAEGKSYFLAEGERIRDLLAAKESGKQHLFLLDEIFRGTNTTERIAAGKAVLAELDRGDNLVVVATHDLELLPMLAGRFTPYHFREEVDGDSLRFDYAINSGPSSTRNAIALLRLMKYPERVIDDALAALRWADESGAQ